MRIRFVSKLPCDVSSWTYHLLFILTHRGRHKMVDILFRSPHPSICIEIIFIKILFQNSLSSLISQLPNCYQIMQRAVFCINVQNDPVLNGCYERTSFRESWIQNLSLDGYPILRQSAPVNRSIYINRIIDLSFRHMNHCHVVVSRTMGSRPQWNWNPIRQCGWLKPRPHFLNWTCPMATARCLFSRIVTWVGWCLYGLMSNPPRYETFKMTGVIDWQTKQEDK